MFATPSVFATASTVRQNNLCKVPSSWSHVTSVYGRIRILRQFLITGHGPFFFASVDISRTQLSILFIWDYSEIFKVL